jgi:hypothetical protein
MLSRAAVRILGATGRGASAASLSQVISDSRGGACGLVAREIDVGPLVLDEKHDPPSARCCAFIWSVPAVGASQRGSQVPPVVSTAADSLPSRTACAGPGRQNSNW